ncbi:hypothetical protein HanPSC8_Chr09g0396331 [Helianthus annuus]|nr:hypothetical protein HanPSC8_Chr09g0396331 [Helianthus annuus]
MPKDELIAWWPTIGEGHTPRRRRSDPRRFATQPLPSMQPYDPSYTQPDLSLPHFSRSDQTMPLFPLSDLSMQASGTSYTVYTAQPVTLY